MGLGHILLRRFTARVASNYDFFCLRGSEKVSYGSVALGTALGAAGLFVCASSPALLESQPSHEEGPEQVVERFPNAFSRKGQASGWQDPYMAYNREGQSVPLAEIVQRMKDADVVLLGETHDDSIAHQLQLQLMLGAIKLLRRAGRQLTLSLEMFERDVQGVMDEYLAGSITERDLRQDARPWPNYDTDYRPMVEVAKQEGLPVICANAPRRYVSLAGRSGRGALEQLPQESKQWLPPLPYRQPSQAYIHKTNWTMQQAKDELDAARKQKGESADDDSNGDAAAESRSAAINEEQCPGFRHSADPRAEDGLTVSMQAQRGSYAGQNSPLLGADSFSGRRTEQNSSDAVSGVPQDSNRAEAIKGDTAGTLETSEEASADSAEGGGCPYIGFTMSSNFLDAQCLWDATMAYSIAQGLGRLPKLQKHSSSSQESTLSSAHDSHAALAALSNATSAPNNSIALSHGSTDVSAQSEAAHASSSSTPVAALQHNPLVLHVCGKFHSEGWMGIYEHIHAYHVANARRQGRDPKRLDVVIVTFLPSSRDLGLTSEEFKEERLAAYGDYVILTDFNRPRSFEVGHPV